MNESVRHHITHTLAPLASQLKTGLTGPPAHRASVMKIVDECEQLLKDMACREDLTPMTLNQHLIRLSKEIGETLALLTQRKSFAAHVLRSRGNRRKLEKAYHPEFRQR